jgi:hypothetical protein
MVSLLINIILYCQTIEFIELLRLTYLPLLELEAMRFEGHLHMVLDTLRTAQLFLQVIHPTYGVGINSFHKILPSIRLTLFVDDQVLQLFLFIKYLRILVFISHFKHRKTILRLSG